MKHLKHKSEMPKTLQIWRRRQPWPTWWGATVASKLGFKGTSRATVSDLLLALERSGEEGPWRPAGCGGERRGAAALGQGSAVVV
jgi:hypothetical protein